MPKQLTLDCCTFNFPIQGDTPGWGEDLTDWATKVTQLLNATCGSGSISLRERTIVNSACSCTLSCLIFPPTTVSSFEVTYVVVRGNDYLAACSTTNISETGKMFGVFDENCGGCSAWEFSIEATGCAGVTFDICSGSGQITYTSTNLGCGCCIGGEIRYFAASIPRNIV